MLRIAPAALAAFGFIASLSIGSVPVRAADQVSIVTTGKGSPLEWPLYIAMNTGPFAANNLNVELYSADSTAAAMQQIASGSGDIGIGGLTDPIHAIDNGAPVAILMLETEKPPYSLWSKPSIKSIDGLRKKTIIVGGAKDITRIYFDRMVQGSGLKPDDYDLVYAGTTPARYAALLSGAVDAAILYPPASFLAPGAGLEKLGELSDFVKDLPFTGYAVNTNWANTHQKAVTEFLTAMAQSVVWFYDPKNKKAAIDLLVKQAAIQPDVAEKTYDYFTSIHVYPDHNTLDVSMLTALLQSLSSTHDLVGTPDPARFINAHIADLVKATK